MRVATVISALAILIGCVSANDELLMKVWSAQLENALEMEIGGDLEAAPAIPELANNLGETILAKILQATGLNVTLAGKGPFTLFGPTNEAFKSLPKPVIFILKHNMTILKAVLKYHVASGNVLSKDLKDNQLIKSLEGKQIRINIYKNGTVITASGRRVTLADQRASNGVIHEVGQVLFPPPGTVSFALSKCPDFAELSQYLTSTGLAKTLGGKGPFTVFAPTNKAFMKLPMHCLEKLASNKTLLTDVLKFHVVGGAAYSAGLTCGEELKTLNGNSVKVTLHKGVLARVNRAHVIYPDLTVTNGVVHAIDHVLLPDDDICDDVSAEESKFKEDISTWLLDAL